MQTTKRLRAVRALIDRLEDRRLLSAVVPVITQTNLVSDGAVAALHTDPNLVNPWGVAITNTGNVWVANNGTDTSTFYDQAGTPQSLVVAIPGPGGTGSGTPTGVAFNKSKSFKVSNGTASAASEYVFVGEDGVISGWAPTLDLTHAFVAVDHSSAGDVFKGVALQGNKIYATDFHHGTVEVFDKNFAPVTLKAGAFTDSTLPAGFAPFGISSVKGKIFVTYALQDIDAHDDLPGAGVGFVDEFSSSGKLIKRVASGGELNSPWAVTIAPSGWGKFSGDILVGNFGDGHITVFDKHNNDIGQLASSNGSAISIGGLWALTPGVQSKIAKHEIFFAGGTNDEADGLFGVLSATVPTVSKAVVGTTGTPRMPGY